MGRAAVPAAVFTVGAAAAAAVDAPAGPTSRKASLLRAAMMGPAGGAAGWELSVSCRGLRSGGVALEAVPLQAPAKLADRGGCAAQTSPIGQDAIRCVGFPASAASKIGERGGDAAAPKGGHWLDASTQRQLAKTVRALKYIVLKQTAHALPLFGPGSVPLSMVFSIRKSSSAKHKAFRIRLPCRLSPSADSTEGLFFKTSAGKRVLGIQVGWCSMDEDALIQNATASIAAARQAVDRSLVQEIRLEAVKSSLPVWSHACREKKRKKHATRMPPPACPPAKKSRTL